MEGALIAHTVEIIFLLDEFILALCAQEGGTCPITRDQMNNCL